MGRTRIRTVREVGGFINERREGRGGREMSRDLEEVS